MSQHAIRPVSTRSALLTAMIGGPLRVDGLDAAQLVAIGGYLGTSESTVRVALTRMVAGGDLERAGNLYMLSERLRVRRDRQRLAMHPKTKRWRGDWELVVVTVTGRAAVDRALLRDRLGDLRLAELREGVWMRPDNLGRAWVDDAVQRFVVRPPEGADDLAASLWDLPGWVARGERILAAVADAESQGERFAACVAGVRHLLTDPVMPDGLRPEDWPAARIRAAYDESLSWMAALL